MDKPTILVTGGAGFIGSHLVRALVKRGLKVRVLDNVSRNVNNVQDLTKQGKIDFLKGDIRNKNHVTLAMKGIEYVFHEAAVCLNRCVAFPKEAVEVNLEGSYNVFGAAIQAKVKKIIFASTSSVYGEPEYIPIDEKHPTNPVTPYGATKLCVDHFARFFAKKHGMKFIGLRYFNVYGPNQSTDAYYTSVINLFIKRVLLGARPIILGSGEQTFDFTYISDVVRANLLAMESDIENEMFNVGFGYPCSIETLAWMILKAFNSDQKPEFIAREVPITRRICNPKKIERFLDFHCQVILEDGLKKLIDYIKKHPETC